MKILLFTLEYPPFKGGIANYYGNIVKHWPKPNEIFVLDNNKNKLIKNWLYPKWLLAFFQLKKVIKKNKIEHILIGHILPLGTITYLLGLKYSVILHGLDFSLASKSGKKKWLTKKILKRADNIICANTYLAKSVANFLGNKEKIIIVNPGVENELSRDVKYETEIKNKYNLNDKLIILTVGRLVKRKGIDTVLKTLPDVLKKIPNLYYIIFGNGPELNNIKKLIAQLNLDNYVKIIIDADDRNKNAFYNISDIFIMPSRKIEEDFEGFGIVYLEANLAGKPVIAGNSGGVSDAVHDHINGLLVAPDSLEEIGASIISLVNNKNLRQNLGEQGKIRAINKFNWNKQTELIYNSLEK